MVHFSRKELHDRTRSKKIAKYRRMRHSKYDDITMYPPCYKPHRALRCAIKSKINKYHKNGKINDYVQPRRYIQRQTTWWDCGFEKPKVIDKK